MSEVRPVKDVTESRSVTVRVTVRVTHLSDRLRYTVGLRHKAWELGGGGAFFYCVNIEALNNSLACFYVRYRRGVPSTDYGEQDITYKR